MSHESANPLSAPTHITVIASTDGFRRGGRAWSTQPETVACADFTPAQLDALRAEPELIVVPVPAPDGADTRGEGDALLDPAPPEGSAGMHDWPAADAPMGGADASDADDRIERIRETIRSLDPQDKTLWTSEGAPKVSAIERTMGEGVTAAERDAALEAID